MVIFFQTISFKMIYSIWDFLTILLENNCHFDNLLWFYINYLLLSLKQIMWFNTQQLRSWLDGDHLITHLYTHIAIVHPFCNPQILLMTRFDRTRRVPTQFDATLSCSSNSDMSCNYCTLESLQLWSCKYLVINIK